MKLILGLLPVLLLLFGTVFSDDNHPEIIEGPGSMIPRINGKPAIILDDESDEQKAEDALEITTKILEIGGAIEPLGVVFEPIAALGGLVLSIFKIGTRSDPVMDKLNEIEHEIDLLGREMNQQFAEMKAYISEESFDRDVVQVSITLHQFMQDTVSYPGNESISIFYAEYIRNPPLEVGYRLMSLLQIPATNPLKAAMDADPLKSAYTFNKWNATLTSVMVQLLYIETYANGMFGNSTLYGSNRLADRITELRKEIDGWGQKYMESYWPGVVQKLITDTQDNHQGDTHTLNAQRIREGLNKIMQPDGYIYYAIVYDPVSGYVKHAYDDNGEILVSLRRGNCNAAVMRTLKSRCPNSQITNVVASEIIQQRHKHKSDNRCLDMLNDAHYYNPASPSQYIIGGANPAIYNTGNVSPGAISLSYSMTWIATF